MESYQFHYVAKPANVPPMAFSFTVHGQPDEKTAAGILSAQLGDVITQLAADHGVDGKAVAPKPAKAPKPLTAKQQEAATKKAAAAEAKAAKDAAKAAAAAK